MKLGISLVLGLVSLVSYGQTPVGMSSSAAFLADRSSGSKDAYKPSPDDLPMFLNDDAGARYPVVIDSWVQKAKLTASDSTGLDGFGFSVSASGNTIMVGAPEAVLSQEQGAIYVFVKSASGHITQIAKLTSSDGAGHLGWSLSLYSDTLVAGAPYTDIGNNQYQGAAYVFVKPAGGWKDMTETAKLTASDGAPGDGLGWSVSLSGDTLVAGSPSATINNQYQGAIYLFAKPPGGWKSTSKFTAKITTSDGGFGAGSPPQNSRPG